MLLRDQNTRERQIEEMTRVVGAVLAFANLGGQTEGHVFTWRKAQARLAVRRWP
jgi:hypothetical protein